jgi:hypothetical protein
VEPRPKENEVVSFTYFHSFGLGVPAHPLLQWLLYYYGLCLHDLTPEGILHLSVFIMLCEGFVGVPAHYELWQSFFWVVCSVPERVHLPRTGDALIQLCPRLEERYLSLDRYPSMDLGWQKSWLYVPNESMSLPFYSPDRLHGDLPESWEELPPLEAYKHRVPNLLDAIKDLKDWGLAGTRVIRTFIGYWVLPLKMRHHP